MTTQRLSPGTQLSLMRGAAPAPISRVAGDGRVTVVPSPNGMVHLLSKTIDGKWIAEHLCLESDVDDKLIRAMERRAKKHERAAMTIVR